jgi:gas vesicle protein
MKKEETNISTKLSYLLIGGGIGAILALLFAPKAGEEFRAEIADAARKGMDKTEDLAGQIGKTAQTVYADSKAKAGEIYDSTKQKLGSFAGAIPETPADLQKPRQDKIEQIKPVIEAGRKEYDREDRLQGEQSKGNSN